MAKTRYFMMKRFADGATEVLQYSQSEAEEIFGPFDLARLTNGEVIGHNFSRWLADAAMVIDLEKAGLAALPPLPALSLQPKRNFTTYSPEVLASLVTLKVGAVYRVTFAGEKVRAKFLGARDLGGGRRVRLGKTALDWERV